MIYSKTARAGFIIMLASTMIALTSCCIHRQTKKGMDDINIACDSTASSFMGDSIFSIFTSARSATAVNKSISLSNTTDTTVILKPDATATLRFMIETPDNYLSDNPVYGLFNPSVIYIFKSGKKEISVVFDFGLEKWGISDEAGKLLFTRDLRNNDILRFSRHIFPTDPLLESIDKK